MSGPQRAPAGCRHVPAEALAVTAHEMWLDEPLPMRQLPGLPLPAAVSFNDLYRFDPAAVKWTTLSPSGSAPSPRFAMGFAATPDGMLYVFGGHDGIKERGGGCCDAWHWLHGRQSCCVHVQHRYSLCLV